MYERVRFAIEAGVFEHGLCKLVPAPSESEVQTAERELGLRLSDPHRQLLLEWGGCGLDEIRIRGPAELGLSQSLLIFASDYSGYQFGYDADGVVFAIDSDGGNVTKLAGDLPCFINDVLLGTEGASFYGAEWVNHLKLRGVA